MADAGIKKMVEDSKRAVEAEHDAAAKQLRGELKKLRDAALDQI